MPPNMEEFILSNNMIQGTLPTPLENLDEMRRFDMGSNMLSGTLPDFSVAYPNLQELDLSDQKRGNNSGLSGSIARLSNLPFINSLNLAGNDLAGQIPAALGNLRQFKRLILSDNEFSNTIPSELGELSGDLRFFVHGS